MPEADATIPGSARERPAAPESARESGGLGPQETTILDLAGLHEPWGASLRAEGTVADLYVYVLVCVYVNVYVYAYV